MIRFFSITVVAGLMCLAAPAAHAQMPDFTQMDINGLNTRLNMQRNRAMATQQDQIIANVLANPQAIAAYQAGLCGYGLSPQQFAYKWAATAGCTPEGTAYYMNNERRNAYNEQQAIAAYRRAQAARTWAMQNQQRGFYTNQYERGMMLGGWKYQYLPDGRYYWYR